MKLSELKTLVASIEAATLPGNPDPEVSFWTNYEVERQIRNPDRPIFIDCAPVVAEARTHRTHAGNFSWELGLTENVK